MALPSASSARSAQRIAPGVALSRAMSLHGCAVDVDDGSPRPHVFVRVDVSHVVDGRRGVDVLERLAHCEPPYAATARCWNGHLR